MNLLDRDNWRSLLAVVKTSQENQNWQQLNRYGKIYYIFDKISLEAEVSHAKGKMRERRETSTGR